jgi:hypothetical protein
MTQPFPMDSHYRMDVIGPAASVMCGMFCAVAGAPALYYRSLGTMSTLLRIGNISGKLYC